MTASTPGAEQVCHKEKSMNKIILIYPSTKNYNVPNHIIIPLSLIYVATPLKTDFNIKIIDQRVDMGWRNTLKQELSSNDVICTGISSMTGPQLSGGIEAASMIKEYSPAVPIVWGGVHPSLTPEETIKSELVDIIVIGSGEETFRELVDVLQKGGDKKAVKGLIYRDGDSVFRTPVRKIFPINEIGPPAYDLVDMERYNFIAPWVNKKSIPIITSRGCPFRCAYCYNTSFMQKRWTSLSSEETLTLMTGYAEKYNIKNFFLLDDNFFGNLKRVKQICELLIENNSGFSIYNANCRIDTIVKMDEGFLRLLKKAGFRQMLAGVESGSNEVLARIKKDITVEQVLIASTKLKNAGITPYYSFMAGFPFESIDDIKKTLLLMNRLLKENPAALVNKLQIFTPFPGTELFQYAAGLGMKLPSSLAEWATYHYDNINFNCFNSSHEKFLENAAYYTTFLDDKLLAGSNRYLQFIARLYSMILKFRIDHNFYPFMYELYPLRGIRSMRKKLLAGDN